MAFSTLADPWQWVALALTLVTGGVVLTRRVLLLNRAVWPPTPAHWASLALTLLAWVLFWASLNAVRAAVALQLLAGAFSTLFIWVTYVFLVNERIGYPTRQQLLSLGFYVLTEVLIQLQLRVVLRVLDAQ